MSENCMKKRKRKRNKMCLDTFQKRVFSSSVFKKGAEETYSGNMFKKRVEQACSQYSLKQIPG